MRREEGKEREEGEGERGKGREEESDAIGGRARGRALLDRGVC